MIQLNTQAISDRSGKLWECRSRRPFLGGYVYLLQLRKQFDDVTPHPALAARAKAASVAFEQTAPFFEPKGSYFYDSILVDKYKYKFSLLKPFGYRQWKDATGVYLELPDKEAIEAVWEKIRKTRPELKKLDVLTIENEEGDLPFIEAFFTHLVFLSKKGLFVHDNISHTMNQLEFLLQASSETLKEMEKVKRFVLSVHLTIQQGKKDSLPIDIPRMENILGSFIDNITQSTSKDKLDWVCDVAFKGYMDGVESTNPTPPLRPLWKALVENEKQSDYRRHYDFF